MDSKEKFKQEAQKYEQICQISDTLLQRSVERDYEFSDEDKNLIDFFGDKENLENLKIKIQNAASAEKNLRSIIAADKTKDAMVLETKLLKLKNEQRRRTLKRWSIRLAVASATLAAIVLMFTHSINQERKIICQNSETELSAPTIVLENGEEIILDPNINNDRIKSHNLFLSEKDKIKYRKGAMRDTVIYNTLRVPSRYTYNLELSDGTEVTLNANSRIKFPTAFCGSSREVELDGEAYFRVAKSDKPFIVKAGICRVKVYGTQFNVNMRGECMETVLVTGKIGFRVDDQKEHMVRPNQLVRFDRANDKTNIINVEPEKYLGWMTNSFHFEQKPAEEVLNEISAWYGVTFIVNNQALKDILISINVDRDMRIESMLKALEEMLHVKINHEGDTIYSLNETM